MIASATEQNNESMQSLIAAFVAHHGAVTTWYPCENPRGQAYTSAGSAYCEAIKIRCLRSVWEHIIEMRSLVLDGENPNRIEHTAA